MVEFKDYGHIQRLQFLNTFVEFKNFACVQRLRLRSETLVEFGDLGWVWRL